MGSEMCIRDSVFASPSHLLGRNTDAHFNLLRARSKATYVYSRGYVERLYNVSTRSDLVVRATGQLSSGRLLPTEQLGFGGFNTVRGYDMRAANGDNGYILNFEFRTKPITGCCNGKETSLTLLAFSDFAQQFNWRPENAINELNGEILASAGVGFRYLIDPNCTIRFDYGFPFTELPNNIHDNKNGRVHIGAVFAY